jgi:predicted nucleic acid-binding protein
MLGLTFDTGALIGLERRHATIATVFALAAKQGRTITVPAPVVTEWWRGRSRKREDILASIDVEPLDAVLAKLAGDALAAVHGASVVDAIVMASASRRGDIVYTSDERDLIRLQAFFPRTRLARV